LDPAFLIPFRRRDELNAEGIIRHIEITLQSNKEFSLSDSKMEWRLTTIKVPQGGMSPTRHFRLVYWSAAIWY
jgi:hypothetical protein